MNLAYLVKVLILVCKQKTSNDRFINEDEPFSNIPKIVKILTPVEFDAKTSYFYTFNTKWFKS